MERIYLQVGLADLKNQILKFQSRCEWVNFEYKYWLNPIPIGLFLSNIDGGYKN